MRTGIALGSNLGDRLANLRAGRAAIVSLREITKPILSSRIYETDPVDCLPGTPAYLNAVIEVSYAGSIMSLLQMLQNIEKTMGRPDRRPKNVSRVIDLDILYCGHLSVDNEEIVLPHPRLHLRRFVLEPLADIAPETVLPGRSSSIRQILAGLPQDEGVHLFGETL